MKLNEISHVLRLAKFCATFRDALIDRVIYTFVLNQSFSRTGNGDLKPLSKLKGGGLTLYNFKKLFTFLVVQQVRYKFF